MNTIRNRVCFCKYINFSTDSYRGGENKISPINSSFEPLLTIFCKKTINDYSLLYVRVIPANECKQKKIHFF